MASLRKTAALAAALLLVALGPGCGRGNSGAADEDDHLPHVTTREEFAGQVLKASKPVLVDFYATWCGPCKQLAPTILALSREYEGRVEFVKVDGDKAQDLISDYGVQGYPTVVIFSGGKPVSRLVGLRAPDEYRAALDAAAGLGNTGKR